MKNTKLLPSVLLMGIAISISYTTETQGVMSLNPPETTTSKETQHEAAASQAQPILKNQSSTSQSSQQAQSDKKTDISSDVAMRLERERSLAMGAGQKQQNDFGRIVATVNGENIYQEEVDKVLRRFGPQVSQEQIPTATKQILDGLITQKLILQFVRDNKIQVTPADIEVELNKVRDDIKSNPGLAGQTLEQVLEKRGGSIDDMKKDITMFLSMEKYLSKDGLDDKKMSPKAKEKIIEERGQLLVKQLREKATIDIK